MAVIINLAWSPIMMGKPIRKPIFIRWIQRANQVPIGKSMLIGSAVNTGILPMKRNCWQPSIRTFCQNIRLLNPACFFLCKNHIGLALILGCQQFLCIGSIPVFTADPINMDLPIGTCLTLCVHLIKIGLRIYFPIVIRLHAKSMITAIISVAVLYIQRRFRMLIRDGTKRSIPALFMRETLSRLKSFTTNLFQIKKLTMSDFSV